MGIANLLIKVECIVAVFRAAELGIRRSFKSCHSHVGNQYYGSSPTTGRVNALAYDPNDSQVIYAGGAQGGLWKSQDGGTTWVWLSKIWTQMAINCITIDLERRASIGAFANAGGAIKAAGNRTDITAQLDKLLPDREAK